MFEVQFFYGVDDDYAEYTENGFDTYKNALAYAKEFLEDGDTYAKAKIVTSKDVAVLTVERKIEVKKL